MTTSDGPNQMSRWLVSEVPPGLLLVAMVVVVVGGAALIQRLVRARFPGLTGEAHNDVTRFAYGFIGFVYAFLIGFVVSNTWGQINSADVDARAEGAAAVQMVRASAVFEPVERSAVRAALRAYEHAALAEWDDADTRTSPAADAALTDLYTAYQRVTPTTDVQRTALAASMTDLDQVSQARTVRLLTAREDTGPPWGLWVVMLVTSAMVLGTAIVYGVERPGFHYPMVAIVGVIVAINLFLVLELSHPYLGAVSTSSDPLRAVVEALSRAT